MKPIWISICTENLQPYQHHIVEYYHITHRTISLRTNDEDSSHTNEVLAIKQTISILIL